jgi:hypothetical protein
MQRYCAQGPCQRSGAMRMIQPSGGSSAGGNFVPGRTASGHGPSYTGTAVTTMLSR